MSASSIGVSTVGHGVHQLTIEPVFHTLTNREKLYAHHLSRAAWHGARILMRQTSAEGPAIFDLIMALHGACGGEWEQFTHRCDLEAGDVALFVEFCAMFLSNMGNYFGSGDQKFVPKVSAECVRKMASISPETSELLDAVLEPMFSVLPHSLGFPDDTHQSNYYPGPEKITEEEAAIASEALEKHSIAPDNTRVRKLAEGSGATLQVLQASADQDPEPRTLSAPRGDEPIPGPNVHLVRGDHAQELTRVCSALEEAQKHAPNDKQVSILADLIEHFRTGNQTAFHNSQKTWVTDMAPRVETILGFVEPYRDPLGVRCEWEGIICIADTEGSRRLGELVAASAKFTRELPWAVEGVNDGKGPFESDVFVAPDFTIVHVLAFCSSVIWDATNLPNFNDIRETLGSKNLVYVNRMSTYNNPSYACPWVHTSDVDAFRNSSVAVRFVLNGVHELLGHGSGKLLSETSPGEYNFDHEAPPLNPLTGEPVATWYRPGQTWNGVFGKLAATVEECRAILISYFLIDNEELLGLFGHSESSELTAEEVIYNAYLSIGVEGLLALEFYNPDDQTWGQAHRRANFAILQHLLRDGGGVLAIDHDPAAETLRVRVDRTKILSHGKPSLGRMLLRIHLWRCVADAPSCAAYYEELSAVEGTEVEEWRRLVVARPEPKWKFVQANTFIGEDGRVGIRVYEETNEGLIQSFAERGL